MDGGAWWAAVHGVAKSRAQLSDFAFTYYKDPLEGTRRVGGLLGVAGRLSGTVSPFRAEQGTSLETPWRGTFGSYT